MPTLALISLCETRCVRRSRGAAVSNKHLPANADVVDARTELHAVRVRTARHGVPQSAGEEADEREGGENNLRWLIGLQGTEERG